MRSKNVFVYFILLLLINTLLATSLVVNHTLTPVQADNRGKDKGKDDDKNKKPTLILQLANGVDINPILKNYRLTLINQITSDNRYLVQLQSNNVSQISNALAKESGVVGVEPNITLAANISAQGQPQNFPGGGLHVLGVDPTLFYNQQLSTFLQLDQVHALSQGQGIKIAVIDTGVDQSHPLLASNIDANGYDFVDNDNLAYDEPGGVSSGHGTFISGLILLLAPQAQILPIRVLDNNGLGTSFNVACAIRYAVDQGAQVINLSLGVQGESSPVLISAITYAKNNGSVVVAAVGNSNSISDDIFPANQTYVVATAATDFSDLKASFSNYGHDVTLDAPGVNLVSTFPGGLYASWSGTSFATPLVSAESALIFASQQGTAVNVISTITRPDSVISISSLQPVIYRNLLGKGRISPLQALQNNKNH